MRAHVPLMVVLPLLAGCEAQPVPAPEPRPTADPVMIEAETDRTVLLSGAVGTEDFKVNFGEPFVGFENRGTRMGIRQTSSDPGYRVIDVARTRDGNATVFRASEGVVPGDEAFVLTIIPAACTDEFSGERTGYVAWLGTASNPRRARSCAARAK